MSILSRTYVKSRVDRIDRNIGELPEYDDLRQDGPGRQSVQELIEQILTAIMEVIEHLHSRLNRSRSPAYRDRVRQLVGLGLFEEHFVERHLVPLARIYETRVTLRLELADEDLEAVLNQHDDALEKIKRQFNRLIEEPDEFGFRIES